MTTLTDFGVCYTFNSGDDFTRQVTREGESALGPFSLLLEVFTNFSFSLDTYEICHLIRIVDYDRYLFVI